MKAPVKLGIQNFEMPIELRDLAREYSQTAHLTNFKFAKVCHLVPQQASSILNPDTTKARASTTVNDYSDLKAFSKEIASDKMQNAGLVIAPGRLRYSDLIPSH